MSDDIINQLLPFIHDEMRMPAGMIIYVIEEIERLHQRIIDLEKEKDMWEKQARI